MKKNKTKITLYVRDSDKVRNLADEVASLYYERYGECPSQAEVIEKSLLIAKDFLKGSVALKNKHEDVTDLFARS